IPSPTGAGSSLNPRESLCPLWFRLSRTATEDSDGKAECLESKPQPRFRDNLRPRETESISSSSEEALRETSTRRTDDDDLYRARHCGLSSRGIRSSWQCQERELARCRRPRQSRRLLRPKGR